MAALMALARDLPAVWNASGTEARTRQRITHILIREVIIDLDDATNEAVVTLHWAGGRHTALRVSRVRTGRYPEGRGASPVDAIRKMGGQWPDREIAVTLNRMRCKPTDGKAWTTVRVREMRDRLGVPPFSASVDAVETISAERAAARLGICVGSVQRLIRDGVLPATQVLPSAPWQIPVAALTTPPVVEGVQAIMSRRTRNYPVSQGETTLRLPGL